jgi:hypothetical protein
MAVCRGKLTLDNGHDGALLDGGRALETVGVDSAEELSLEVHCVEGVGRLIVVGLDLALGHILKTLISHDCDGEAGDYWYCTVVGEKLLVGWVKRGILWMPPRESKVRV